MAAVASLVVDEDSGEGPSLEAVIVVVTGAADGVTPLTRSKAVNLLPRPMLQTSAAMGTPTSIHHPTWGFRIWGDRNLVASDLNRNQKWDGAESRTRISQARKWIAGRKRGYGARSWPCNILGSQRRE